MKYKLLLILILNGVYHISAEDDFSRLLSQYDRGEISREDWIVTSIRRLLPEAEPVSFELLKCGTPIIQSLRRNYTLLSPATQKLLSTLGIKSYGDNFSFTRPTGLNETYDLDGYRIHYTTTGSDAVETTDLNANGIPDYIDIIAAIASKVDSLELNSYNFSTPPADGWYAENGGDERYDIYVKSLSWGLYGYVNPEYLANSYSGDNENTSRIESNAFTSYMVLRNNYEGFPTPQTESLQVTIAHEFFHAIQFGYDGWEATWMLEATATWMEDEVYDEINDNYQYLLDWFKNPGTALNLDSSTRWYGSFIFFRYLSEHLGGPTTIRRIFEQGIKHDSYDDDFSILTIDEALDSLGVSFEEGLTAMTITNQILSSRASFKEYTYEEAQDYRAYGIQPHYQERAFLNTDEYTFMYSENDLMSNAGHNIELVGLNSPMDAVFAPAKDIDDKELLTSWCVIQTPEDGILIYGIGTSTTTIPIPSEADSVAVVVVTKNEPDANFTYSLFIIPEIPLPSKITLLQNFPNPANGKHTTIRFFLPEKEDKATLTLYDLLGRRLKRMQMTSPQAGFNDVKLNTGRMANGIYVVQLQAGSKKAERVISIVKGKNE